MNNYMDQDQWKTTSGRARPLPYRPSEVQACIEGKPCVGDWKIGLSRAAGRVRCRESSEVRAVDVRAAGQERPSRVVHHVDDIHAHFEFFAFRKLDALYEVYVHARVR